MSRRAAAASTATCAALAALTLGACATDLGPPSEWIDAAAITGPLAPSQAPPPRSPGPPPAQLRVVTWNVAKGADVEGLAAAIRATPALAIADVILLQEIEDHPGEGGARAARLAAALDLGYAYAPERLEGDGTHGPAILSRWPLARVEVMELPYAELAFSQVPRRALAADLQIGATALRVVDMHLDTRLNAGDRILQLRPAVLDAPAPAVVGGDLNTNPYVWTGGAVPDVPGATVVDTDQAPVIDAYMRGVGYATPTAALGPTEQFLGLVAARLDSLYARGVVATPGAVERAITLSDHWPVWIDVALP